MCSGRIIYHVHVFQILHKAKMHCRQKGHLVLVVFVALHSTKQLFSVSLNDVFCFYQSDGVDKQKREVRVKIV